MEELLRISGAVKETEGMEALRDYTLEVYRGDILYIQGVPGSGVRTLARLFAGECTLQRGRLYLHGQEILAPDRLSFWQHGLYAIAAQRDLVEKMTVAENLEAIRYLPNCMKIYRQKESREKVAAFLRERGIDVPPSALVWSLRGGDRAQLSLIKARMHGARLIVLDTTKELYEGQEARALCEMIRRENRAGITFVILSECYSAFARVATRIQLVDQGRDIKEWTELTARVESVLRGSTPLKRQKKSGKEHAPFLGIFDPAWERRGSFWDYLRELRSENPDIWAKYLNIEIPEDGCCRAGNTVVIPRESGEMLLSNLSIADNLILPCAARVAVNRLGMIPRHVRRSVDMRFRARFGLPTGLQRVEQLDRVSRKILSIYRYELLRPAAMVLESPYAGMMSSEAMRLRQYLWELADGGIRVLCFARSADVWMEDCPVIVVAHNAKDAKISTE